MTSTITVAPVRKQVRVQANADRAFQVFTDGMTRWWPRTKSINTSPIEAVVLEPRVGGRWFERGVDGSECQWGAVLVWEPGRHLVLNWQIDAQWRFDPQLTTEVDVRFVEDAEGTTVQLEHRLDGFGAAADQMRQIFDGPAAWQGALESFAHEIETAT